MEKSKTIVAGFLVAALAAIHAVPTNAQSHHTGLNGIIQAGGCDQGVVQFVQVPAAQRKYGFGGTTSVCRLSPTVDSSEGFAQLQVTFPSRHGRLDPSKFEQLRVWLNGTERERIVATFCSGPPFNSLIEVPVSAFQKSTVGTDGWQRYIITAGTLSAIGFQQNRLNKVLFRLENIASSESVLIGKITSSTATGFNIPSDIDMTPLPCNAFSLCNQP